MARPKLILYFDMHSPFAYLAFNVVKNSPVSKQCQVEYVPILLAGLVNAIGAKPPWAIKNKAQWVQADRMRWARQFSIPMAEGWPEEYPDALTLEVQRAICGCKLEYPNHFVDVVDALYSAFWSERKAIQLETGYKPILEKVLGTTESENVLSKVSWRPLTSTATS